MTNFDFPFAEAHAKEIAKAREGYLPIGEVSAKIKEMDERYAETYKAWESAKAKAAEWRTKHDELHRQAGREQEMRESTIKEVQTRFDAPKEVIFEHASKILGKFFNVCCSIGKSTESPCIA